MEGGVRPLHRDFCVCQTAFGSGAEAGMPASVVVRLPLTIITSTENLERESISHLVSPFLYFSAYLTLYIKVGNVPTKNIQPVSYPMPYIPPYLCIPIPFHVNPLIYILHNPPSVYAPSFILSSTPSANPPLFLLLRKHLPPDLQPPLLPRREPPPGALERPAQHLP